MAGARGPHWWQRACGSWPARERGSGPHHPDLARVGLGPHRPGEPAPGLQVQLRQQRQRREGVRGGHGHSSEPLSVRGPGHDGQGLCDARGHRGGLQRPRDPRGGHHWRQHVRRGQGHYLGGGACAGLWRLWLCVQRGGGSELGGGGCVGAGEWGPRGGGGGMCFCEDLWCSVCVPKLCVWSARCLQVEERVVCMCVCGAVDGVVAVPGRTRGR